MLTRTQQIEHVATSHFVAVVETFCNQQELCEDKLHDGRQIFIFVAFHETVTVSLNA